MLVVKFKRNGNIYPSLVSDFFPIGTLVRPNNFDFDDDLSDLSTTIPSVNITENLKDYKIELAAPGLEKKDFKIETDNDLITISSEKKEENENYNKKEFSYQNFSRSFLVPQNSLPEKVEARYENGILKLTLPKKEVIVSKPKKEIQVA